MSMADRIIGEAVKRGDFDDLPNRGQKLDFDDPEGLPGELRLSNRVLKNAGYVPEEIQLRKDIDALKQRLSQAIDADHKAALQQQINTKSMQFAMLMERYGMNPLDADRIGDSASHEG